MKKAIIAAMLSLSSVGFSSASISINFETIAGYLGITGATDASGVFEGTSLIQVIWTPTASYSSAFAVGGALDSGHTLLWSSHVTVSGGLTQGGDLDGTATYPDSLVSPLHINNGYIYARIFDSVAPIIGSHYTISNLVGPSLGEATPANPADPPDQSDVVDLGRGPIEVDRSSEGYYVNPLNLVVNPICWQCLPGRGGWRATIHKGR